MIKTDGKGRVGILADGRKYVVEGSKKAKKADLDFELVLDKDLARAAVMSRLARCRARS